MLATAVTAVATGWAAPLGILSILASAMIAGRAASTWNALLHGACAWLVMVLGGAVVHPSTPAWHGVFVLWVLLLVIEDVAIIGRIGHVRQQIARRHEQV
jgi:hypothetical protein